METSLPIYSAYDKAALKSKVIICLLCKYRMGRSLENLPCFLMKEIVLALTVLASIDRDIFKFWIQNSLMDLLMIIVQNCDNHVG